jgi:hypothetical protein
MPPQQPDGPLDVFDHSFDFSTHEWRLEWASDEGADVALAPIRRNGLWARYPASG